MTVKSPQALMTLAQLLPQDDVAKAASVQVTGLCLDSRRLVAGDVFIALSGSKLDGRQFIADAISKGAVAVLVDAEKNNETVTWQDQVPVIAIRQLAAEVGGIASRFYGEPSQHMRVIGITGTNGKTTCSLLLGQLLALLQMRSAVLGTIGYGVLDSSNVAPLNQQLGALKATGLTTPDAVSLQKAFADLRTQQVQALAMEVSSHSLQQGRVNAIKFDTAIFTNLTQDHLDYHGTMKAYGKAKAQLLAAPELRCAILNADDPWAKNLITQAPDKVSVLSYSILDNSADIYAHNIILSSSGVTADIVTPWGEGKLQSPLLGAFNLSNLLSVIAAVCIDGVPLSDVLDVVPRLYAAPGRMESVSIDQSAQDISVIVDYAHTPDALETTLNAVRELNRGRVWTIFGCGGDRDKTKRPLMGRIAERLSDYTIVTNDNPRTEDPANIATDILRGMHNAHGCLVIADRAQAIDLAVQQAKSGDVVLVAGKGHEDYQIFATQTLPFSDVKQARLALQRRIARHDAQNSPEVSP